MLVESSHDDADIVCGSMEGASKVDGSEDSLNARFQVCEDAQGGATASVEHVPVSVDYTKKDPEKDKRKSIFGFLSKLGGRKKHRKSTENLLAVDEAIEHSAKVNTEERDHVDEEDGVVPLEMQRDVEGRHTYLMKSSYFILQISLQTLVAFASVCKFRVLYVLCSLLQCRILDYLLYSKISQGNYVRNQTQKYDNYFQFASETCFAS